MLARKHKDNFVYSIRNFSIEVCVACEACFDKDDEKHEKNDATI